MKGILMEFLRCDENMEEKHCEGNKKFYLPKHFGS
jgi:hypothetical protein